MAIGDDDELDATSFPAWREAMASHEAPAGLPRTYPGYPTVALPAATPRRFRAPALDRVLAQRRASPVLGTQLPPASTFGRIVGLAHGITGPDSRGATPSAGGLQALELYVASWAPGWLAAGWYHYDRRAHHLARLVDEATRAAVVAHVPSLAVLEGGALVFVLVGDHARVAARYTRRALRFLLLEAGHLVQNLALVATSCGLGVTPLGGAYERALATTLALPRGDRVLYVAALG